MNDADRKRENVESFGGAADAYRDSAVHREGSDLDTLAAWCEDATRALDVACGGGHTAGALAEAGVPTVVASDLTREMVVTATATFPVEGVVSDAERLPFEDDSFDAVTCRIAAHHFPNPKTFVAEVGRVLAPGGVFAFEDNVAPEDEGLADFFNEFEALRDSTHGEAYSQTEWEGILGDAGFDVEESLTMRKELDYESWVERTDPEEEARERLSELVRTPEAQQVYGVSVEDGNVQNFGNRKLMVRARN
ncbi:class I SAM-dependent methyltransferase [Halorussus halophilus]|uniref:class I SAM-dependent methyltransferase n=1 Tax=Halorussus halophilus TaxID=2650975 RepID=UPI0013011E40|nr:class I SAM-dependent methyltransferase [Halorussus halophilus]